MSHDKIEVTWDVADGYAGKSRPQITRIRREEIESAIDEADVREIVEQSIQSDFESRIAPDYGESVYTEALAIWRQSQAEKQQRSTLPMAIEERKMSRPDSRWKAELLGLYRSAESLRAEMPDAASQEYQTGIMMACSAIWHRVTGEPLVK